MQSIIILHIIVGLFYSLFIISKRLFIKKASLASKSNASVKLS